MGGRIGGLRELGMGGPARVAAYLNGFGDRSTADDGTSPSAAPNQGPIPYITNGGGKYGVPGTTNHTGGHKPAFGF